MALGFLGCYIHFFKAYAWGQAFLLSGCVGVSLVVAMVISSLVGTIIPMLFHKIHIDPAVASGPLITTINDLVAVVVVLWPCHGRADRSVPSGVTRKRTLSVISLCSMPAPPRGELLCIRFSFDDA